MIFDVDDLASLSGLTHQLTLECLKTRYAQGVIYTSAGCALLALNPFKYVKGDTKPTSGVEPTKPHVYKIAHHAIEKISLGLSSKENIVITGDSGAGKTVSARLVLEYVCSFNSHQMCTNHMSRLEQKIVDASPLLEAIGNAKTIYNNNSSRFGKFMELFFDSQNQLTGAKVQTYLLEKVRVTHFSGGEGSFHIFSQLMAVMMKENTCRDLGLPDSLVHSLCTRLHVSAHESLQGWEKTYAAMNSVGLTDAQHVVQTLIACLLLSQVTFSVSGEEKCCLNTAHADSSASVRAVCQLLGVDSAKLGQALTHRTITATHSRRQSIFHKPCTLSECQGRRDCMSRFIYARLFDHIIDSVNDVIKPSDSKHCTRTLGILDMYGFEVFETNNLEQLCINYANEKMQQLYVCQVLRDQQAEYMEEAIGWSVSDFTDNRPCLDLLDGASGIFALLNEECSLNRAPNDDQLASRISSTFEHCQSFVVGKRVAAEFSVTHYAGLVTYAVPALLEKNKDNVPAELVDLLSASDNAFVSQLFTDTTQGSGKKKRTVLAKFKQSLDELMGQLSGCQCQYIRCIKPNKQQAAGVFDEAYVGLQVRAAGIIEAVDVTRRGFSVRQSYSEFLKRHAVILMAAERHIMERSSVIGTPVQVRGSSTALTDLDSIDDMFMCQLDLTPRRQLKSRRQQDRRRTGLSSVEHSRKCCASILNTVFPTDSSAMVARQFGKTKIFLTDSQAMAIEEARLKALSVFAYIIQQAWRRYCLRRVLRNLRASSKLAAAMRGWCVRRQMERRRLAVVHIQRSYRLHKALTAALPASGHQNRFTTSPLNMPQPCTVHLQVSFNTRSDCEQQPGRTACTSPALTAPYSEHNGIVSRRHVLQIPIRFHLKNTALKFGHVLPWQIFQYSLTDAL